MGTEVTSRIAIAEGGGRMIAGHADEPDARLPDRQHREAEGQRRQKIAEAPGGHGVNAIRRSAMRPTTPIAPTSAADSAAAANSAAQICTVWP